MRLFDKCRFINATCCLFIMLFLPCSRLIAQVTNNVTADLLIKAEAGDTNAITRLVVSFVNLEPKDREKTKKWFLKRAAAGDNEAMYRLALIYVMDDTDPQNTELAFTWYMKAAEKGHTGAMTHLAEYYMEGKVVRPNYAEAVRLLTLAAEKGEALAMYSLADCCFTGKGKTQNYSEAFKWYLSAAEKGNSFAMLSLGKCYLYGLGITQNRDEASRWFNKALHDKNMLMIAGAEWYREVAEQGSHEGMLNLGRCYYSGLGYVQKSIPEAVKWFQKAALAGNKKARVLLGVSYDEGEGVLQNDVYAYAWYSLASIDGDVDAKKLRDLKRHEMTPEMIEEGQKLASTILRDIENNSSGSGANKYPSLDNAIKAGTGFFITTNGYFLTAAHVISKTRRVTIHLMESNYVANVISVNDKLDVALLKAEGFFPALQILSSTGTKLGSDVFTIGFPNITFQGSSPKLTKGVVSGLNGIQDDPSCFQISVTVQPGNSGGPLINTDGCVIGVINARLNDLTTAEMTGSLPQNVNYAVKSSYVLPLLESISEGSHLQTPKINMTFEETVNLAESATCIIMAQ